MDASRWKTRIATAARFLLPPRCLVCGDIGDGVRDICAPCVRLLARNVSCCGRCAVPLEIAASECEQCAGVERPWADLWVPFVYAWPLDRLESRFKFGGSLPCGRVLADCWLESGVPPSLPDLLVPVPLHVSRLRSRGYNQAWELARVLGKGLSIPARHDVLKRSRATSAQSELDATARIGNVRGAFVVDRHPVQRHVAIVDDVMTTGATLEACVTALRDAGIARVDVWALARTPRAARC